MSLPRGVRHQDSYQDGVEMPVFFNQQAFVIRCEWGACGVTELAPESDAVVIVDVLSFTTCVEIAVGNGATLTLATGQVPTFAGCLRNATAVANAVEQRGRRISVIPAGERWDDGSLRPALEDLVGAGAIISHLPGTRSPEAELAVAAFQHFRHDVRAGLTPCGSARELIGRGFACDVDLALALDVSDCVPVFTHGAYRHQEV